MATETAEHLTTDNHSETLTNGRNLRTRKGATDDHAGSTKGYDSGNPQTILPSTTIPHLQSTQPSRPPGPDRSVLYAAGALAVGAHTERLPTETGEYLTIFAQCENVN